MMTQTGWRAKRLAGGGPLQRRVRPHSGTDLPDASAAKNAPLGTTGALLPLGQSHEPEQGYAQMREPRCQDDGEGTVQC